MVVAAWLGVGDDEVDGLVKARRSAKGLEKMLGQRRATTRLLGAVR